MNGSYQLLHDTPARREDYTIVTKSSDFPFFFCGTILVEDKQASDRLICIWPNMLKIVNYWESLAASKRPSSKSYVSVNAATKAVLTTAKLSFFSYLASLFQPFLCKYQTREPVMPYLHGDLVNLYKGVLKLVIKDEVIDKCTSSHMLTKIDFSKDANFKANQDCHLGISTVSILSGLKRKDAVKAGAIKEFYVAVRNCIVVCMKKMNEKSPLTPIVVRNAIVFFYPNVIMANKESILLKKLKLLLQHLASLNIMTSQSGDKAYLQFSSMKEDLESATVDLDLGFSNIGCLDNFYFQTLKVGKYSELSNVIKIVLTSSHGQVDVERGFSENNRVLEDNIKVESIVSKRLLNDFMLSKSLKPHRIEISSKLRASCRAARQRYQTFLEDQKKTAANLSAENAKEILNMEIGSLQDKISRLDASINSLNDKFVKMAQKAEVTEPGEMMLIISEANGLKRKSEEQVDDRRKLEESVELLKKKRSEL